MLHGMPWKMINCTLPSEIMFLNLAVCLGISYIHSKQISTTVYPSFQMEELIAGILTYVHTHKAFGASFEKLLSFLTFFLISFLQ